MFSWFGQKRYVVATVLVGLSGLTAAPLLGVLNRASRKILDSDGDFAVTSAELATACGALIDYETSWTHTANWGEVFTKEEQAGDYGAEMFTDLSQRYLSSGEESSQAIPPSAKPPQNIVVMLTVAYLGEEPTLENPLTSATGLQQALNAIVSLYRKNQLQLAHLHYAPARFGDDLDADQLLVNYPELVAL